MINTFHSSYNPPPVPPRAGYSKPQPPGNTPMVKFLSVMLLLLMILTFGGFLYLFQKLNVQELRGSYPADLLRLENCVNDKLGEDSVAECGQLIEKYKDVIAKVSQANEKVSKLTGGPSFNGPAAYMVLLNQHKDTNSEFQRSNYLLWDRDDSLLQDVGLNSKRDMLIIHYPGIYFIYSQVTFSKHSKSALMQAVRSPEPTKEKDKELLKSFCSLNPSKPNLCTASLVGVFRLQKDQQLYVTVTNTSLVNRDSCSFGLFKLR
ncbi:CD40 ligand isoform X1 [Ctenopharyngodon idella]|uniref:CD154 n=1 Tax=Ctenopharyngodon idella TaxID=7959 RepID=A0A343SWB1_CTEID|nr:CD40 ligand isoform X1 [Ctenopharyngodon idella]AUT77172.1 CD154 [Ctenopharyngodon idella]AXY96378.1 CD154 [Ctenopharyngodon idella]